MIGFFRRLLKDRRGNVLAIACATMPLVIGAAGLATDTTEWTLWKRQLQRAADSAAFAGVYDRSAASGATTNTPTAVCRDLAVNLHTWMSLVGTSPCTGTVGSYTTLSYPSDTTYTSNQVMVTLKIQQALPFSSLFMSSAPVITASATAGTVSAGTPCALALNNSGTAMNYSGNATGPKDPTANELGGNQTAALWTDARNGRGSGAPPTLEAGRNPICEQSDVFFDVYSAQSGGSASSGSGNNDSLFLVTPCPTDIQTKTQP